MRPSSVVAASGPLEGRAPLAVVLAETGAGALGEEMTYDVGMLPGGGPAQRGATESPRMSGTCFPP